MGKMALLFSCNEIENEQAYNSEDPDKHKQKHSKYGQCGGQILNSQTISNPDSGLVYELFVHLRSGFWMLNQKQ